MACFVVAIVEAVYLGVITGAHIFAYGSVYPVANIFASKKVAEHFPILQFILLVWGLISPVLLLL